MSEKSVNFDNVILFREQNSHENSIIIGLLFLAAFTVYWFWWWNNRVVVATMVAEKNSNYACHCRIVGKLPTICLRLHKRKTSDNKDLNQVVTSSGFSENKGLGGVLSLAGS